MNFKSQNELQIIIANAATKEKSFISLPKQPFLRFLAGTTPVITGAQGVKKGGYSIDTPYIVHTYSIDSVIVTITFGLKIGKKIQSNLDLLL
jgi:hypothetical protein